MNHMKNVYGMVIKNKLTACMCVKVFVLCFSTFVISSIPLKETVVTNAMWVQL